MPTIERVTVIGAGTMGRQIALQAAWSGHHATLYDTDAAALGRAQAVQQAELSDWQAAGKATDATAAATMARMRYAAILAEAVAGADLAIEVVPERIAIKRAVFAQLDALLGPQAILATNSSSIRVSLLEDATARPELVANLHFFLPVWKHPMVEIGGGTRTSPATLDQLTAFARRMGLLPLRVRKESTGFIHNRIWRAIKKEALRVVDTGVASHEDVDRAWMIEYGTFNLPPFALMDLVGLDVIKDIEEHYARESGDPADLPPPLLTDKVARGELGVKSGCGFYSYPNPAFADPNFLKPD